MDSVRSIENDSNLPASAAELVQAAALKTIAAAQNPLARSRSSIPLWLWWNILSLDAPAVATMWAMLFARASRIEIPPATIAVLALAVWVIYLGDRLLDASGDRRNLKERHRFCERHRLAVCALCVLGTLAGACLAYKALNAADVKAGFLLAGFVGAYMVCVHAGGTSVSRFFHKEIAVGVLFAAGTSLPIWAQPRAFSWDGLCVWALFGLICTLNCLAIESWEGETSARTSENERPRRMSWAHSHIAILAAATAVLSVTGVCLLQSHSIAISAVAIAAFLILLLNSIRTRLSGHALRVLADAAILIPAIFALLR